MRFRQYRKCTKNSIFFLKYSVEGNTAYNVYKMLSDVVHLSWQTKRYGQRLVTACRLLMKKILICLFIGLLSFDQTRAQDSNDKTVVLETLGVLSAVTVYNTYLAIGAVADGYGTTYEAEYAISLMNEQSSFLSKTQEQLDALVATKFLDENDKDFVKRTSECVNYLRNQAEAMAKYAKTEAQADLDSYNFYRDRAWKLIEDLLGLKED